MPGLGMIGTPAAAPEDSNTLTQGPEAPLEEENPSASSDDENLEASLYQCAVQLSYVGTIEQPSISGVWLVTSLACFHTLVAYINFWPLLSVDMHALMYAHDRSLHSQLPYIHGGYLL